MGGKKNIWGNFHQIAWVTYIMLKLKPKLKCDLSCVKLTWIAVACDVNGTWLIWKETMYNSEVRTRDFWWTKGRCGKRKGIPREEQYLLHCVYIESVDHFIKTIWNSLRYQLKATQVDMEVFWTKWREDWCLTSRIQRDTMVCEVIWLNW